MNHTLIVCALLSPAVTLAAPGFATLDRADAATRVGAEYRYGTGFGGGLFSNDFSASSIHLFGQGVISPGATSIGVDASLPITGRLSNDDDSEGSIALGSLQLGVYGVLKSGWVIRLGIATATEFNEVEDVARAVTGPARLTDYVTTFPETTWGRLSGSHLGHSGVLFSRVDLGLDLPLASEDFDDIVARANFGVGVRPTRMLSLTAELANLVVLTSDGDLDDRALHTFTAGLRLHADGFEPYFAFVKPLDEGLNEATFLTVGVSYVP